MEDGLWSLFLHMPPPHFYIPMYLSLVLLFCAYCSNPPPYLPPLFSKVISEKQPCLNLMLYHMCMFCLSCAFVCISFWHWEGERKRKKRRETGLDRQRGREEEWKRQNTHTHTHKTWLYAKNRKPLRQAGERGSEVKEHEWLVFSDRPQTDGVLVLRANPAKLNSEQTADAEEHQVLLNSVFPWIKISQSICNSVH